MLGVILNSIVIAQYLKFSSIRKRLAHILLLNQAVADLVNCLVYLTPLIVTHFHNVTYREYPNILDPLFGSAAFLSFSSSLYLFLIIAIERYLSIVKPLWHRINVRRVHICRSIRILWLLAIIFACVSFYFYIKSYNGERDPLVYYTTVLQVKSGLIILLVSALFALTFYKALVSIRGRHLPGDAQTQKKKEFMLTATFTIMYVSFFVCFLPFIFADASKKSPKNRLKILCFSLTSIMNPILTLRVWKEFCICNKED